MNPRTRVTKIKNRFFLEFAVDLPDGQPPSFLPTREDRPMQVRLKPYQCVTNAPEDYDYRWAKTLIANLFTDERGKVYRLVEVEDDWHFRQQVMRYGSGMNNTLDNQIVLDDHLRYGWLKPTEKPEVVYRRTFDFENARNWPQEKRDRLVAEVDGIRQIDGVKFDTHKGGRAYSLEVRGYEAKFNEIVKKLEAFTA